MHHIEATVALFVLLIDWKLSDSWDLSILIGLNASDLISNKLGNRTWRTQFQFFDGLRALIVLTDSLVI